MGIKYLNRFLTKHCSNTSLSKCEFSQLSGKTIVVDTSIYLYKFSSQNALYENFYTLISKFRQHNITPLFVFDGKPPPEKFDLLQERKNTKDEASNKYDVLNTTLGDVTDEKQRTQIMKEMNNLKRDFVRISRDQIQEVKLIMDSYGVQHYVAQGESDKECAYLVANGKAFACMSDDMDMFVYGCSRVLRHLNLSNSSLMLYNLDSILSELKWTFYEFWQIAVLSGTDYNTTTETSLIESLRWFKSYKMSSSSKMDTEHGFYEWLRSNTKYIDDFDILMNTHKMFCVKTGEYPSLDELNIQMNNKYDTTQLQCVMNKHGFIFAT